MPTFISLTEECIEDSTRVKKNKNARRLIALV